MYVDAINGLARDLQAIMPAISSNRTRGRTPTSAFSNFAINREQGMWAESILAHSLRDAIGGNYDIVKYGRSDSIMAGEKGFREFYERYQDELDNIGKRPDLLIFHKGTVDKLDISEDGPGGKNECVRNSILGIEVRSSSLLARKYAEVKKSEASFTPKIEDLQTVLKWIQAYGVPHYYAQVFFDEIHVISFRKILETLLCDPDGYVLRKNYRNQFKGTIHVNISRGSRWGKIHVPPTHESGRKELGAGRLIHYVKFGNGRIDLDGGATGRIIREALGSR